MKSRLYINFCSVVKSLWIFVVFWAHFPNDLTTKMSVPKELLFARFAFKMSFLLQKPPACLTQKKTRRRGIFPYPLGFWRCFCLSYTGRYLYSRMTITNTTPGKRNINVKPVLNILVSNTRIQLLIYKYKHALYSALQIHFYKKKHYWTCFPRTPQYHIFILD